MIDYWAKCGVCKQIAPTYEELSDLPEFSDVEFYKVDCGEQTEIAEWFQEGVEFRKVGHIEMIEVFHSEVTIAIVAYIHDLQVWREGWRLRYGGS